LGYAQPVPRIAIHKHDMVSAARTLITNLDPERLAELMDLLLAHAVHEVETKLPPLADWYNGLFEEEDLPHHCLACGSLLDLVRPGKWQCPTCE
jgi:hypothetical protein